MTTRKQRARLISRDDVERVLDDSAIQCLAQAARLPRRADLTRFGRYVRAAVHQYLNDANVPQPSEHRATIDSLARKLRDALDDKPGALEAAVAFFEAIPPATRKVLEDVHDPENIPTVRDLRDPVHGRKELVRLYGLCHRGAEWKAGRRRPGGKRSRPRLEPLLIGPRVRPGRPSNHAEFVLCTWLAIAYELLAERPPPFQADRRNPGPFVRLVRDVLALAGAADVDAVEMVEAYGRSSMALYQRKIQDRIKSQIRRLSPHLRLLGIEFPLKD